MLLFIYTIYSLLCHGFNKGKTSVIYLLIPRLVLVSHRLSRLLSLPNIQSGIQQNRPSYDCHVCRDANIHIQKIGRIQTEMREIFKTPCNFNCTKLARKREIAQFGCQNGQKYLKKRESPSERGRVGISVSVSEHVINE